MKRLPWRFGLYVVVIGYMFFDLKVCHGPLHSAMRSRRDDAVTEARSRGWVALVNLEPITREQVDMAVARHLYQRGIDATSLSEKNRAMIRRAVLQLLIDETLVRQHAAGDRFIAPAAETEAFVRAWKAGFSSQDELKKRAEAQGWTLTTLDEELKQIWTRKRWLEKRIEPGVTVTEEEARQWFNENRLDENGKVRYGFYAEEAENLGKRRPLEFEELRDEIISHIEAERTAETIPILMQKLRKVANLSLFPENL